MDSADKIPATLFADGTQGYARAKSWHAVQKAAKLLLAASKREDCADAPKPASRDDRAPGIRRHFWFDRSAPESLSCVLLDALVSGGRVIDSIGVVRDAGGRELGEDLTRHEMDELRSLCWLLQNTRQVVDLGEAADADNQDCDRVLPPDAGIYLCWYSQLRELIARKPLLAEELRVCALPGGGFKGDWFIGVLKGSVSLELGETVVHRVCESREMYKRFSRGIGLPVPKDFYTVDPKNQFYAWPRGRHVPLSELGKIHDDAKSRSNITKYRQIQSTLCAIARQLTDLDGASFCEKAQETQDAIIKNTVGRLFAQCRLLNSDWPPHASPLTIAQT